MISSPGDRPPQSLELRRRKVGPPRPREVEDVLATDRGLAINLLKDPPQIELQSLPGHIAPTAEGCVIHPGTVIEVWRDGRRKIWDIPGRVSCVDPEHHDHGQDLDDSDPVY